MKELKVGTLLKFTRRMPPDGLIYDDLCIFLAKLPSSSKTSILILTPRKSTYHLESAMEIEFWFDELE